VDRSDSIESGKCGLPRLIDGNGADVKEALSAEVTAKIVLEQTVGSA
jgi:hypothetical protein